MSSKSIIFRFDSFKIFCIHYCNNNSQSQLFIFLSCFIFLFCFDGRIWAPLLSGHVSFSCLSPWTCDLGWVWAARSFFFLIDMHFMRFLVLVFMSFVCGMMFNHIAPIKLVSVYVQHWGLNKIYTLFQSKLSFNLCIYYLTC